MIVRNGNLQCLECDECGEQVEIRRSLLRDQHAMLELLETTAKEHEPCEEFKGDPERAALERKYRASMKEEMRLSK